MLQGKLKVFFPPNYFPLSFLNYSPLSIQKGLITEFEFVFPSTSQ